MSEIDRNEEIKAGVTELKASIKTVQLPIELVKLVRTFVASANNHLMAQKVVGDAIISSAKLMMVAGDICKQLDEIDE